MLKDVIIIGVKSWALLALAIGILFISIVILNKVSGRKNDKRGKGK